MTEPLPETKSGKKYTVTFITYFSKWPEAEALANKDADSVARFIFKTCR